MPVRMLEYTANLMEKYVLPTLIKGSSHFDDDEVIAVTSGKTETGETVTLPLPAATEPLRGHKPEGNWTL